jgi:hypothetical protein
LTRAGRVDACDGRIDLVVRAADVLVACETADEGRSDGIGFCVENI